jgi:ribosome maturation factor RimP
LSEQQLRQIQETVEDRLAEAKPEVELLALEQPAAERLRLVIDREGGVDLELCEAVTRLLPDLNEDWSLEVSSPGPERPLTKPEHFERFVGRRVRVKTHEEIEGRKSFTGLLESAGDDSVALAVDQRTVTIPLAAVRRSNLLTEDGGEPSRSGAPSPVTTNGAGERPAPAGDPNDQHANGGGSA